MKLQRREKILAAIFAALALFMAGWLLTFAGDSRSTRELRSIRERLTVEVSDKEARVQAAGLAARRLAQWQRRALPSDAAHARSLYQDWLRQLAAGLQFRQLNVDSSPGQTRPNTYALFNFTLHGRAALDKLVEFLYKFYSAGHLHQISRITVKTVENSPELDIAMSVEAMSLPAADRQKELTKEPGKSLRLAGLSDYVQPIVGRNWFTPFSGGPPDMAQTTFVTAIVAVDGQGEVWLADRTSGMNWKLHEGERLQVGSMQGVIKTIGEQEITVDIGGRLRRLRKGDNLLAGGEPPGGMTPPQAVPGHRPRRQPVAGPSDAVPHPMPVPRMEKR